MGDGGMGLFRWLREYFRPSAIAAAKDNEIEELMDRVRNRVQRLDNSYSDLMDTLDRTPVRRGRR